MSIEVWLGGSTGKISPELKAVNSFEKHIHDIDYEITGMTDKNMEVFIGRLLRSANKRLLADRAKNINGHQCVAAIF